MKHFKPALLGALAALLIAGAAPARAQLRITEVAPWASGNAPYASDWFELTNTGSTALNIAGFRMDDSSNSFATAAALTGIGSIAAGESVIFLESASANAGFLSTWFGTSAPAGLQVGNYSGTGVGLSTGGDAVYIFNALGVAQAGVSFGTADAVSPYQSFDNASGLNGVAITQLSAVGVNGASVAFANAAEIGSPGRIAPVPEPSTYALLMAGLGLVGVVVRKRKA